MATVTRSSPAAGVLPRALVGARGGLKASARARAWAAQALPVALGTMVAAGLALVLLASQRPSALVPPAKGGFEGWLVGPFQGLASFVPDDRLLDSFAFSALVGVMFACWLVALAGARRGVARPVLAAIAVLHAVFLVGPPLPLTDVFNYIDYARLGALHGLNPYADLPAAVPGDPAYAHSTWHHLVSPYGPLFTLGSYALVPLGLTGAFWALKVATVAASLGCLWLVWRLAERRGRDPVAATALVGLNPLVLVYGVGGVHNDFFMLLAVLAGTAAVLAGRPGRGGAALTTAAALKLSSGLVLPFALAGASAVGRRRLLLGAAAVGGALVAASALAFGLHVPGLEAQSTLVTPLGPPNLVGVLLGQGGATDAVRILVQVGLGVTLLVLLRATWRGADWITMAGWALFALVVSLTWEMPWYVLWVLPFAALSHSRALRRATVVLTAFLLLTLVPSTGYVLTDVCHCNPSGTKTGKRNAAEIRRHLR